MKVVRFYNRENYGNSYAVIEGDEFVLIDCTQTPQFVASKIGNINIGGNIVVDKEDSAVLRCVGVFITHGHYDHFSELALWVDLGANVFAAEEAYIKFANAYTNCCGSFDKVYTVNVPDELRNTVEDGQILHMLDMDIKIHKLPGHTDCSIAMELDNYLFVGDIIFSGGAYGRCDLPTGSEIAMANTLQKINSMDDDLNIRSGHGLGFKLGECKPFRM